MSAVETVETLISALQANDLELAARKMSDEFLLQGLGPRDLRKNELLAIQSEFHAGLSDFNYNLTDLREEENRIKGFIAISGTQTQNLNLPMFGLTNVPATGLFISLPQTPVLFEVEADLVSLMQIVPVPGGSITGLIQQLGTEIPVELVEDTESQ